MGNLTLCWSARWGDLSAWWKERRGELSSSIREMNSASMLHTSLYILMEICLFFEVVGLGREMIKFWNFYFSFYRA